MPVSWNHWEGIHRPGGPADGSMQNINPGDRAFEPELLALMYNTV